MSPVLWLAFGQVGRATVPRQGHRSRTSQSSSILLDVGRSLVLDLSGENGEGSKKNGGVVLDWIRGSLLPADGAGGDGL